MNILKSIKPVMKSIGDALKDRRIQTVLIIILIILVIMSMCNREDFQVIDLIVPPLDEVSCVEYAYGCRINGYRVEPLMVYKCLLQGKDNKEDIKYLKYKIIDTDNVTRYSGLYNNLEGVKVGEYITFDNGQEYIVSTLDVVSLPKACATIRMKQLKK